jgi:hypothetical protein
MHLNGRTTRLEETARRAHLSEPCRAMGRDG